MGHWFTYCILVLPFISAVSSGSAWSWLFPGALKLEKPIRPARIYASAPSRIDITSIRIFSESYYTNYEIRNGTSEPWYYNTTAVYDQKPRYYLYKSGTTDHEYFEIDENHGNITTNQYIDRLEGEEYRILVVALLEGRAINQELTIEVTRYNQFSPKLSLDQYTLEVIVTAAKGTTLLTVDAFDEDEEYYNRQLQYFLAHPDNRTNLDPFLETPTWSPLDIEPYTGEIKVRYPLDMSKSPLKLLVGVSDWGSPQRFAIANLTVYIREMSEPRNVTVRNTTESSVNVCWYAPSHGVPEGYVLSYTPTVLHRNIKQEIVNYTLEELNILAEKDALNITEWFGFGPNYWPIGWFGGFPYGLSNQSYPNRYGFGPVPSNMYNLTHTINETFPESLGTTTPKPNPIWYNANVNVTGTYIPDYHYSRDYHKFSLSPHSQNGYGHDYDYRRGDPYDRNNPNDRYSPYDHRSPSNRHYPTDRNPPYGRHPHDRHPYDRRPYDRQPYNRRPYDPYPPRDRYQSRDHDRSSNRYPPGVRYPINDSYPPHDRSISPNRFPYDYFPLNRYNPNFRSSPHNRYSPAYRNNPNFRYKPHTPSQLYNPNYQPTSGYHYSINYRGASPEISGADYYYRDNYTEPVEPFEIFNNTDYWTGSLQRSTAHFTRIRGLGPQYRYSQKGIPIHLLENTTDTNEQPSVFTPTLTNREYERGIPINKTHPQGLVPVYNPNQFTRGNEQFERKLNNTVHGRLGPIFNPTGYDPLAYHESGYDERSFTVFRDHKPFRNLTKAKPQGLRPSATYPLHLMGLQTGRYITHPQMLRPDPSPPAYLKNKAFSRGNYNLTHSQRFGQTYRPRYTTSQIMENQTDTKGYHRMPVISYWDYQGAYFNHTLEEVTKNLDKGAVNYTLDQVNVTAHLIQTPNATLSGKGLVAEGVIEMHQYCAVISGLNKWTEYVVGVRGWRAERISLPAKPGLGSTTHDFCSNGTCGHGNCSLHVEAPGYTCFCDWGYYGQNCQYYNPCIPENPCLHFGRCVNVSHGTYRCECPTGFYGPNCTLIDPCSAISISPCFNGGTCMSVESQKYRCLCPRGFFGETCEGFDPCSSNPCYYGAWCTNLTNTEFKCHCSLGYSGKLCDIEIDECSSNPCQNGGTCIDATNDFNCQCPEGWGGKTCDVDLESCPAQTMILETGEFHWPSTHHGDIASVVCPYGSKVSAMMKVRVKDKSISSVGIEHKNIELPITTEFSQIVPSSVTPLPIFKGKSLTERHLSSLNSEQEEHKSSSITSEKISTDQSRFLTTQRTLEIETTIASTLFEAKIESSTQVSFYKEDDGLSTTEYNKKAHDLVPNTESVLNFDGPKTTEYFPDIPIAAPVTEINTASEVTEVKRKTVIPAVISSTTPKVMESERKTTKSTLNPSTFISPIKGGYTTHAEWEGGMIHISRRGRRNARIPSEEKSAVTSVNPDGQTQEGWARRRGILSSHIRGATRRNGRRKSKGRRRPQNERKDKEDNSSQEMQIKQQSNNHSVKGMTEDSSGDTKINEHTVIEEKPIAQPHIGEFDESAQNEKNTFDIEAKGNIDSQIQQEKAEVTHANFELTSSRSLVTEESLSVTNDSISTSTSKAEGEELPVIKNIIKSAVPPSYNILSNRVGMAVRSCILLPNGIVVWNIPDTDICREKATQVAEDQAKELASLTSSPTSIDAKIFSEAAQQLTKIVKHALHDSAVANSMVSALSNMMGVNDSVLVAGDGQGNITNQLVETINHFMENVPLDVGDRLELRSDNIVLEARMIKLSNNTITFRPKKTEDDGVANNSNNRRKREAFENNASSTSYESDEPYLMLPPEALSIAKSEDIRLEFVSYNNDKFFRGGRSVGNPVISAKITNASISNLSTPVIYQIPAVTNSDVFEPKCVFWDQQARDWSNVGMATVVKEGVVSCEASHLTAFSVLLDPMPAHLGVHEETLSIISYVGLALSTTGLAITVATYTIFRTLNRDRSGKVVMNLSLVLLLLNIAFIVTTYFKPPSIECTILAAILHYLVVAAFAWMLVEGANMYQLLITVFASAETHFMAKRVIAAWGSPIIFVIIALVWDRSVYVNEERSFCAINPIHNPAVFYSTYFGPICCVLAVNCIVFVMVTRVLCQRRPRSKAQSPSSAQKQSIVTLAQVRGAITVVALLGVTWIAGALSLGEARLTMNYIFCFTTPLQGVIIFVVRVAQHPEAHAAWITLLKTGTLRQRPRTTHTHSTQSSSNTHTTNSAGQSPHRNSHFSIRTRSTRASPASSIKSKPYIHTNGSLKHRNMDINSTRKASESFESKIGKNVEANSSSLLSRIAKRISTSNQEPPLNDLKSHEENMNALNAMESRPVKSDDSAALNSDCPGITIQRELFLDKAFSQRTYHYHSNENGNLQRPHSLVLSQTEYGSKLVVPPSSLAEKYSGLQIPALLSENMDPQSLTDSGIIPSLMPRRSLGSLLLLNDGKEGDDSSWHFVRPPPEGHSDPPNVKEGTLDGQSMPDNGNEAVIYDEKESNYYRGSLKLKSRDISNSNGCIVLAGQRVLTDNSPKFLSGQQLRSSLACHPTLVRAKSELQVGSPQIDQATLRRSSSVFTLGEWEDPRLSHA